MCRRAPADRRQRRARLPAGGRHPASGWYRGKGGTRCGDQGRGGGAGQGRDVSHPSGARPRRNGKHCAPKQRQCQEGNHGRHSQPPESRRSHSTPSHTTTTGTPPHTHEKRAGTPRTTAVQRGIGKWAAGDGRRGWRAVLQERGAATTVELRATPPPTQEGCAPARAGRKEGVVLAR